MPEPTARDGERDIDSAIRQQEQAAQAERERVQQEAQEAARVEQIAKDGPER